MTLIHKQTDLIHFCLSLFTNLSFCHINNSIILMNDKSLIILIFYKYLIRESITKSMQLSFNFMTNRIYNISLKRNIKMKIQKKKVLNLVFVFYCFLDKFSIYLSNFICFIYIFIKKINLKKSFLIINITSYYFNSVYKHFRRLNNHTNLFTLRFLSEWVKKFICYFYLSIKLARNIEKSLLNIFFSWNNKKINSKIFNILSSFLYQLLNVFDKHYITSVFNKIFSCIFFYYTFSKLISTNHFKNKYKCYFAIQKNYFKSFLNIKFHTFSLLEITSMNFSFKNNVDFFSINFFLSKQFNNFKSKDTLCHLFLNIIFQKKELFFNSNLKNRISLFASNSNILFLELFLKQKSRTKKSSYIITLALILLRFSIRRAIKILYYFFDKKIYSRYYLVYYLVN